MPADRVSALLGRPVRDAAGRERGRIVDVEAEPDGAGGLRLTAVLVARGPWGRLLGYERDEVRGPWLLEVAARWILRRRLTRVPWTDLPPEP
ncbi:PRC-barrel domain-containing protein [Micromonospora sp. NPDC048930]|uniref:PRC-barrel domain-containing protein n=1 Tax=Micromonospora sp. NPDC048930 TaxID=3364261 RepID=UPI003715A7E5